MKQPRRSVEKILIPDAGSDPGAVVQRARLRLEVARQSVRLAKEDLKRARQRYKEAKREAKKARKRATEARKAWKESRRVPAEPTGEAPAVHGVVKPRRKRSAAGRTAPGKRKKKASRP